MSAMRKEFFNGSSISPQESRSIYKESHDNLEKKQFDYPEFNKIKDKIQWDVFWDIVSEVAAKSGIKYSDLNRLGLNDIVGVKDFTEADGTKKVDNDVASYMSAVNKIRVEFEKLKEVSVDLESDEEVTVVFVLFHELLHSLSAIQLNVENITSGPFQVSKQDSHVGYHYNQSVIGAEKNKIIYKKQESKFNLLNEAVTENMAMDILVEYAQRTGDFSQAKIASFFSALKEKGHPYQDLVANLKKICEIVGAKNGVDSKTVWEAFVRGIFYKATIDNSEVKKMFAETFSPKFLDELASANDIKDFVAIVQKYSI